MLEVIILCVVVLLIIAGFWWTRGAGGMPGATADPARESIQRYDELGDRVADPAETIDDR
ncbi:MAG TPA: hypothetical protein VNZ01_15525 [Solirubrobacteraceae bacterium]|nr:hypothetical protein [Solirubrobacteraceae bacterium]